MSRAGSKRASSKSSLGRALRQAGKPKRKAPRLDPAPPRRRKPLLAPKVIAAAKKLESPHDKSWIRPGRYEMRNGSIAIVTGPCDIKFGVELRQSWLGWRGHLERHPDGEGLNWALDGRRTDVAGVLHEHDLLRRAKDQKPRK